MAAPGMADWQAQILRGVNAPVTPENIQAVNAWQRAEGGGASNNPFNTTQPVTGASSYNSVGVRNYATPQVGIQATIDTLTNGRYGPVIAALQQGNNPQAVAGAVGASPWGTSGQLMSQILRGSPAPGGISPLPPAQAGAPLPLSTLPAVGSTPAQAGLSVSPLAMLSGLQSMNSPLGGPLAGLQPGNSVLGGLFRQQNPVPLAGLSPMVSWAMSNALADTGGLPKAGAPASIPLGGAPSGGPMPVLGTAKTGDPIPGRYQTSIGVEHPTEGLDGFPAHDYFAPAGSPAVAPVSGTIVKLSGHDPADGPTEGAHGPFGWSVYVQGDNGRTYYMTHMGTRDVKVGQQVKAGQALGTVGNYAKYGTPSHIHMGVSAPGVQVS